MNRFAALGLLAEALDGKQIAVVARTGTEAAAALDDVLVSASSFIGSDGSLDDLNLTVRRVNGDQQIRTPDGGRIRFIAAQQGAVVRLRGSKLDAVLLEPGAASVLDPHDLIALAAKGAEVVRA